VFKEFERCIHEIEKRSESVQEMYNKLYNSLSVYALSETRRNAIPPEENSINKGIEIIRLLMKDSEVGGTYGVKPHVAINKGQMLTEL
jgi:hypothetical protein